MSKSTLVLLGILVVLAVIAFLLMQRPGEQSVTVSEGELFLGLDSSAVDRIEIRSLATAVVMEKRGAEWFVTDPVEDNADQKKVGTFLGTLKELRAGALISTNPDKQSLFQVDSTGIFVHVYERGSKKASFAVGKMGPGFSEVYVRKENSLDVLTVGAPVSYDVRRSANDWRDHALVNVPRETITEIRFQYADETFTLSHRDTAWIIGRELANAQKINSLLSSLSSLQCDDFLDVPPSPVPGAFATVSFSGIDIRFAKLKGSESYAVQTSSGSQWYELRGWSADQVLKRKKDLLTP